MQTNTSNKYNNFYTFPLSDKNVTYSNEPIKTSDYNAIVLHVPEDMVKKGGWLLNDVKSNKLEFTLLMDIICGIIHIAFESTGATHDAVKFAYEMLPTKKSGMDMNEERQRAAQKYVSFYPEKLDKPQTAYNIWVWFKKKRFLPERKSKKKPVVMKNATEKEVVIDHLVRKYWKIRSNNFSKTKNTLPKNPWLEKELSKKSSVYEQLQIALEKFCPCYDFKSDEIRKIVSSSNMSTINDFVDSEKSAFSFSVRLSPYNALVGCYFEMNKESLGPITDLYRFLQSYGIPSDSINGSNENSTYLFPSPRNVLYFPARRITSHTLIVSPWRQKMDLPFMFKLYDTFARFDYPEEVKRLLNINQTFSENNVESDGPSGNEQDIEENYFDAQIPSQQNLVEIDDTANDGTVTGLINKQSLQTNKIPLNQNTREKPMMTVETERSIWERVFSELVLVHKYNDLPSPIDDFCLRSAMAHRLFFSTFVLEDLEVGEANNKQREFFNSQLDDFMDLLESDLVNQEVKIIFNFALSMFKKEKMDTKRVFDWKIENESLDSFSIFGKFMVTIMSQLETLFHCYNNHTYVLNLLLNGWSVYEILNNHLMGHKLTIGNAQTGKSKSYEMVAGMVIPDSLKSRVHTTAGSYLNSSPNIFYMWVYFEEFINLISKGSDKVDLFKNITASNMVVCHRTEKNLKTGQFETVVSEFKRYFMIYISSNHAKTDIDVAMLSRFDVIYLSHVPRVDQSKNETIETEKEKLENNVNQPIIDKALEMIRGMQTFVALTYIMIASKMIVPIDNKLTEEVFSKASKIFGGEGVNVRKAGMMKEFSKVMVLVKAFLEGFVNTNRKFVPENFYDTSIYMYATLETAINSLALMENLDVSVKSVFKKKLIVYFKRDVNVQISKDIVDDILGKYEKQLITKPFGGENEESLLFKKPIINNPKRSNFMSNKNVYKKFGDGDNGDKSDFDKNAPVFVQHYDYNINYYSRPTKNSLYAVYCHIAEAKVEGKKKIIDLGDGKTFSFDKTTGDITNDQVKYLLTELKSKKITTKWMICSKIKEGKILLYFPDDLSCNDKEKFFKIGEWEENIKGCDFTELPPHKYVNKNGIQVSKDSPTRVGVKVLIEPQCRRRPGKDIYYEFPLVLEENNQLMIHRSVLNKKESVHSKDPSISQEKLAEKYLKEMTDPKKMSICNQINGKILRRYCYLLQQGFLTPTTEQKDIVVCLSNPSFAPYLCSVITLKPTDQISINTNTSDLYNETLQIASSLLTPEEYNKFNRSTTKEIDISEKTKVRDFNEYYKHRGAVKTNLIDPDIKSLYERLIKYYIIPNEQSKEKYYPQSDYMVIGEVTDNQYPEKHFNTLINVLNRRTISEIFNKTIVKYPSLNEMPHMKGCKIKNNQVNLMGQMMKHYDFWLVLETSLKLDYQGKMETIDKALEYDENQVKTLVIDKMIGDRMTQEFFGFVSTNKNTWPELLNLYTKLFKGVCTWKKECLKTEKNKEEENRKKMEFMEEMKRSTSKIFDRLMLPNNQSGDDDLEMKTKKNSVINKFNLAHYEIEYSGIFGDFEVFKNSNPVMMKFVCGGVHCMIEVYLQTDPLHGKNLISLEKFLTDDENKQIVDETIIQTMKLLPAICKPTQRQIAIRKWGELNDDRYRYNKEIVKKLMIWLKEKKDEETKKEIIFDLRKYDQKHYDDQYSNSVSILPNDLRDHWFELFVAMNFHVYYEARYWNDFSHALDILSKIQSLLDNKGEVRKNQTVKIGNRDVEISVEFLHKSFYKTLKELQKLGGLINNDDLEGLIEIWKEVEKEDQLKVLSVLLVFYIDHINDTYQKQDLLKAMDESCLTSVPLIDDDENSIGNFVSEEGGEDEMIIEQVSKKRKATEDKDKKKKFQIELSCENEHEYGGSKGTNIDKVSEEGREDEMITQIVTKKRKTTESFDKEKKSQTELSCENEDEYGGRYEEYSESGNEDDSNNKHSSEDKEDIDEKTRDDKRNNNKFK